MFPLQFVLFQRAIQVVQLSNVELFVILFVGCADDDFTVAVVDLDAKRPRRIRNIADSPLEVQLRILPRKDWLADHTHVTNIPNIPHARSVPINVIIFNLI
jgi:hypothetical protein